MIRLVLGLVGHQFDRRRRQHMHAGYPNSIMYHPLRFTDIIDRAEHFHALGHDEVNHRVPASNIPEWSDLLLEHGYGVSWGPMPGGHPGGRLSTLRRGGGEDRDEGGGE